MNKKNSLLPPMQIFNDGNILKLHHTLFSLLSLNYSHKSIEYTFSYNMYIHLYSNCIIEYHTTIQFVA